MFSRKSKLDTSPPKPPTKAEILDDLDTFRLDHTKKERNSTSDSSLNSVGLPKTTTKKERKDSENTEQLEEWWEVFEKFLNDIDKLEEYQKQFKKKKTSLAKLDETISIMGDDIQTRIMDSLEKARAEIPESEPDLK